MSNVLLHTNTEFSFLNSTIKIKDLFKLAVKNNVKALSMTDTNNMFGLGLFLDLCQKNNIKPIIGLELDLEEATIFLIAKNYDGYVFLNKLAFRKSKGEIIGIEELENKNIFVIDHMINGYMSKKIPFPKISNFWANNNIEIFSQTVYAPVKKILYKNEVEILNTLKKIGNLPMENFEFTDYFNKDEFKNVSQTVLKNIEKMVNSIYIKFPSSDIKLANFKNSSNLSNEEYLMQRCLNSLKKNIKQFLKFDYKTVNDRIKHEFNTIKNLGFIDYFLIIVDVLDWARNNNIHIGPGRGSVAGSLIAFLLEITKINPLEYDLLFERFLNSERVTMPDIDIDIQDDRRDEITKYILEKYGYEYTSLITTFQVIGAKMAIRDVARVLQIPLYEVDKISKSIENLESLKHANTSNKKFIGLISKYPKLNQLSQSIEGFPRQHSIHPAGIIISKEKITSIAPTYWNNSNLQQVQLSLSYLEKFGLLKIDFLGLKTLNIINDIEKNLLENYIFENIFKNEKELFSDSKTLKLINNGHTEGIFQLESPGMKNAIKKVKADSFNDLVAIIALFRPGPMQYIEQYGKNKINPNLISKVHPIYDKIVKNTFGIIVYQEQIMEIVQKVANMSFSQADLLRRAISKKDEVELKKYKNSFFKGGKENGFDILKLEEIYNNIEKFADYGFNKSHAVSYAYVTFKMAFYKAYFPHLFYRSLLTSAQGAHSTINKYIDEIQRTGIKVSSPDINKSKKFVVLIERELVLPFNMIKGIGIVAVDKILEERKKRSQYKNFFECFLRLRFFGITDGVIELLIKSNSMRKFGNQQTLTFQLLTAKNLFLKFEVMLKNLTKQKIENSDSVNKDKIFDEYLRDLPIDELLSTVYDQDIEHEAKNEINLLGKIYNSFITIPYEKDIKIENLPMEKEIWVVACVEKIFISKHYDTNKIILYDSTQTLNLYVSYKDFDRFENMPKNIPIFVKLYRSLRNKYYLKNWKEINEE